VRVRGRGEKREKEVRERSACYSKGKDQNKENKLVFRLLRRKWVDRAKTSDSWGFAVHSRGLINFDSHSQVERMSMTVSATEAIRSVLNDDA
jgi:hypothetical protein